MSVYVRAFLGSALAFLVLDAVWLGLVAGDFYRGQLGELMKSPPNWQAAGAFYLLYLSGLLALAVMPALTRGTWWVAATNGAVLGLVAYGTYGLTNLAVLEDWPLGMTLIDMAWGTFLTGAAGTAGYLAAQMRA